MMQGIGDLFFIAFIYIYWISVVIYSDYYKKNNLYIYERQRKRINTLDNNDKSRAR